MFFTHNIKKFLSLHKNQREINKDLFLLASDKKARERIDHKSAYFHT
ncbi:hypothetical protein NEOC65_001105 [Neochlamydia sp. AcF65]|nr:hypothetical protein [Neochlamydia sp. AcF65]MBS4169575.1 hypothetical protein [Neochlamydia sp. AcF95]